MMWYFTIGLLLVMYVDYHTVNMEKEIRLTIIEKLISIMIWPVIIIMVIIELFKDFKNE